MSIDFILHYEILDRLQVILYVQFPQPPETADDDIAVMRCDLCLVCFVAPADWVRHVVNAHPELQGDDNGVDGINGSPVTYTMTTIPTSAVQKTDGAKLMMIPKKSQAARDAYLAATAQPDRVSPQASSQAPSSSTSSSSSSSSSSEASAPSTIMMPPPADPALAKTCPICHKLFPSIASLQIHKRTHTGK